MAVTKIHPIKSTLKKALDYIENPAKTDEKMLVSSFACSYETADIEFELLLSQAMQKGNNLAHHLIQSFAPGETTPEQAHEIGRQLADEVLQGKYPYVLTTHIDKGHVHNHVIFCAVDMVNQRKYVSNRRSYAYIRRTSDRLCKEHMSDLHFALLIASRCLFRAGGLFCFGKLLADGSAGLTDALVPVLVFVN